MNNRIIVALFSCIAAAFVCPAVYGQNGIDLKNWMGDMPGDRPISWLTIPGTHDSGARYDTPLFSNTANAQDLTIAEQLAIGVRFLDIRCRSFYDTFGVWHGPINQNLSFDEVINTCLDFLDAHPSETIIMSVKKEGDDVEGSTLDFQEIMANYIAENPYYWYTKNAIPTLDEARWGIVLVRRFSQHAQLPGDVNPNPDGIDASGWKDPAPEPFRTDGALLQIEDFYNPPGGPKPAAYVAKEIEILNNIDDCANDPSNRMYISFTSATGNVFRDPITSYSDVINPWLINETFVWGYGIYGILAMDHVDENLAWWAVSTNYNL